MIYLQDHNLHFIAVNNNLDKVNYQELNNLHHQDFHNLK